MKYRSIIRNVKIYDIFQLDYTRPYVEKSFRKNYNGFRIYRSTTSQILTIRRIIEEVREKNPDETFLFRFHQSIWFQTQRKDGGKTFCIWSSQRNSYQWNNTL